MNYTTEFKSIRAEVSPEEWQARVDLAACYRLVDKYAMTDLIYNHITARIPGSKDHLLINLYGMLYKEITASSLAKIDVEGEIIWKPGYRLQHQQIGLRDPRRDPMLVPVVLDLEERKRAQDVRRVRRRRRMQISAVELG
jgi:Class II Aldolase and Adducin N-terminal domain